MRITKKALAAVFASLVLISSSWCASKKKVQPYTDDYYSRYYSMDMYYLGEYFYKPNFVEIPGTKSENESLKSIFGEDRYDEFELDGTKLYVGWHDDRITLCTDENTILYNTKTTTEEDCWFNYWVDKKNLGFGVGIEKEINLNGKKYVIAFTGVNTNECGFKMFLRNGPDAESAKGKPMGDYGQIHYPVAAFNAGVYKAGWTKLWWYKQTNESGESVRKYNYKDTILTAAWDNSQNCFIVKQDDGTVVAQSKKNDKFFKFHYTENNGKKYSGMGIGWEGPATINGEELTIALGAFDGDVKIWIKDAE